MSHRNHMQQYDTVTSKHTSARADVSWLWVLWVLNGGNIKVRDYFWLLSSWRSLRREESADGNWGHKTGVHRRRLPLMSTATATLTRANSKNYLAALHPLSPQSLISVFSQRVFPLSAPCSGQIIHKLNVICTLTRCVSCSAPSRQIMRESKWVWGVSSKPELPLEIHARHHPPN